MVIVYLHTYEGHSVQLQDAAQSLTLLSLVVPFLYLDVHAFFSHKIHSFLRHLIDSNSASILLVFNPPELASCSEASSVPFFLLMTSSDRAILGLSVTKQQW